MSIKTVYNISRQRLQLEIAIKFVDQISVLHKVAVSKFEFKSNRIYFYFKGLNRAVTFIKTISLSIFFYI